MSRPASSPLAIALLASSVLAGSGAALADPVFNRIASFPVASNLPSDMPAETQTSSEIIAASQDGNLLIYSDSPAGGIGMVDITDPRAPKAAGFMAMEGEPTSVAVAGPDALVGVNTSENFTAPSGRLAVVNLATKAETASCDLGGQPDSVAVAKDGAYAAVAIENERDEDLNDGEIPQMPAGNLVIFKLTDGVPDCASMVTVDLTGLAEVAPSDPEPEYVDFNDAGEIVVSMQENNHFAIVDAATGKVTANFSAGAVSLEGIDVEDDSKLDFTGSQADVKREPDTVQWIDDDRFISANEGDYEGGSRSFTVWNKDGTVAYESGPAFEHEVIRAGHYPDKRSDAKGVEPEGLEVATFGDATYAFVLSERGSAVGVYRLGEGDPEFLQLLPSGIAPEGAIAIPSRNLLVTSNEEDLVEDGGARSHVMIYERAESEPAYPTIVSDDQDGAPVGWGALSGLAADPEDASRLYAVSDSFYENQPAMFTIDASAKPARITAKTVITRDGQPAEKLDLEGIAPAADGGFWLASEGDAEKEIPHQLLRVDADGAIVEEVPFPEALVAGATRFGAEGVTMDGDTLWVAIQREWKDDPKGSVKLLAYDTASKEWSAVLYPLESAEAGWVGLSEITAHGDHLYVLERDNQIGAAAKLKKLYRVAVADLAPAAIGGELPTVAKQEVHDFIPDLQANGGYVVDKIEGFTIAADGTGYAVTDNDGVDDSSGETLFFPIGKM
ncbi:esterase-like activity of phytase family protein [Aurantimonas sp. HBX-1]|uniref:esterase-like activity of phytase family protein n=1 Tax=Aurantimonas sp. HBX-1 TaxID=2906072 RepID=UPI001F1E763F|nr:esterase-like activity of phytase family protein [Aurantimonas sp. HBX-1]UIJ70826.1 esterase-like activity of phytase family protein [Aurantimonas sp. HBX-1]